MEAYQQGLHRPAAQTLKDCKAKVLESDDVKKMFDDHALMMNQVAGIITCCPPLIRQAF